MKKTIFFFLLGSFSILIGQMPEWAFFKDLDGNRYYLNKNNKIMMSGTRIKNDPIVTYDGAEFYLFQGSQFLKGRQKVKGLKILKSLLHLEVKDYSLVSIQKRAGQIINDYQRQFGSRFNSLNIKANLFLYRINDVTYIHNDEFRYKGLYNGWISVLTTKRRYYRNYRYMGITAGLSTKKKAQQYQAIIAIDCEKFRGSLKNIDQLRLHWNLLTGLDVKQKKEIYRSDKKKIYRIEYEKYSGFEGLYLNKNIGCIVRIISPKNFKEEDNMKRIIESFHIIDL